jgi:regulatory protein
MSRGLDAADVDSAVSELIETGYLDDARYARMFVQDKRQLEQWGSARIRRSLISRGVERSEVDAALAEGDGHREGDELTRAVAVLQRRFPDPPADRRERERAFATLVRRGYEPELARDAVAAHARGG